MVLPFEPVLIAARAARADARPGPARARDAGRPRFDVPANDAQARRFSPAAAKPQAPAPRAVADARENGRLAGTDTAAMSPRRDENTTPNAAASPVGTEQALAGPRGSDETARPEDDAALDRDEDKSSSDPVLAAPAGIADPTIAPPLPAEGMAGDGAKPAAQDAGALSPGVSLNEDQVLSAAVPSAAVPNDPPSTATAAPTPPAIADNPASAAAIVVAQAQAAPGAPALVAEASGAVDAAQAGKTASPASATGADDTILQRPGALQLPFTQGAVPQAGPAGGDDEGKAGEVQKAAGGGQGLYGEASEAATDAVKDAAKGEPAAKESPAGDAAAKLAAALPQALHPASVAPPRHIGQDHAAAAAAAAAGSALPDTDGRAGPQTATVTASLNAVPIEIGLKAAAGFKRIDIRLDPAELGRVDVRLEVSDAGEVKAQLVVDRVETLGLLQRDARTLERAFEQIGLKTGEHSIDLSLRNPGTQSDGPGQQFGGGNGRQDGSARHGTGGNAAARAAAPPETAAAQLQRRSFGGVDVRV